MQTAARQSPLNQGKIQGWARHCQAIIRRFGIKRFALRVCLYAGLTALLAGPMAVAQTPEQTGEAQITLNLQDVDIRVLINTVAEVSGKNFIVDPRVKGKVSVISGASLDPDQLYDVFLSILEVHNFATVDSGNVIKVLPSNVIKQHPTPTLFSPTEATNDSQITQIIQLEHAAVQDLVPIIRPLIPPSSHFAPHVPSNSVVITDTAANIQRILLIIRRIDVPDKRSNTHVVPLDFAKASELATALTQLMTGSTPAKDAATGKVSIQAFDAINSLLVTAPDDQYLKVQALIDELDIERELTSDVNVIRLKHAKAEDLVSILNDVTATTTKGAVSEFSVQADEASNSLVVKASGNQLKSVQGVVDKLDIRRAQVFVETVIAEVSLNQASNLGVTWGAGGPNGGSSVTGTDGTTTTSGQVGNIVNRDNPFTPIGTATIASAFNLASGGLTASLEGFKKYNLNVIINALRTDTDSNILSTPTILTLDNESAEIVVGQEVPFVTGRFNNGFNNSTSTDGTTGNQTVSTGNNFQTIERKDVGIKLKIKPQISDGNTIQLEVMQEISSVSTTAVAGQADLITDRRSIEAIVQVDDGQVVVLGGLMVDNVVDTESRVPILGSIPVLGALFRTKGKTAEKRNLMIFLKPRIIRTPEQLAKYSRNKYDDLRRDSEISRLNTSSFMIEDADPAVLVEYDKSTGEGQLRSERQARLDREEEQRAIPKEPRTLRNLFKRKSKDGDTNSFKTEGQIEQELQQKIDAEMAPGSSSRIDWDRPVSPPNNTLPENSSSDQSEPVETISAGER